MPKYFLTVLLLLMLGNAASAQKCDVLVYGGTPAGIAAAIAAAQDGAQVRLIEPYQRIGGLVTNGLSHTDFHSRESCTGAFREFAQRVHDYYVNQYGADSLQARACDDGVFAEPKVNHLVFQQMLTEHANIQLLTNYRLQSVETVAVLPSATYPDARKRIVRVTLTGPDKSQKVFQSRVVVDASYEGDLMAMAGARWRAGREGSDEYTESLAPPQADNQVQAYNFRFIMTKDPANRILPIEPAGYHREDFVGVLDALQSGQINKVFDYPAKCIFKAHLPPLPNDKYDINDVSRNLVRLSLPGKNSGWPDGDHATRQSIFAEHLRDQIGLLYFLQNDEAVPDRFRNEARQWGWCRDEFESTHHLPEQLYVREARRMIGMHVYVQRDSEHAPGDARAVLHRDAIAMGDYGNNCHGTAHEGPRFGGKHTGEFYNPVPPYQIPYFVLIPREIDNLLVPTATSSSHVGFCGLRLEPIWMVLGQAAGHAAAMVSGQDITVQTVNVRSLQHRLHRAGSATIYVSDVLPGDPDFIGVQWWGTLGAFHGLNPMPIKPGGRGRNLHGQYYAANLGHAVELDRMLDEKTAKRWLALARLAGMPDSALPAVTTQMTRGAFIRAIFQQAEQLQITQALGTVPREHPRALRNSHAPGEVDNFELVRRVVLDPFQLPGIVVDDVDAELTGQWQISTHTPPYVGAGYLHDQREGKGSKSARFTPTIPREGRYEVRLSHCTNVRRAENVQVKIRHADGDSIVTVDEQKMPEHADLFTTLGNYRFTQGRSGWVEITTTGTENRYVVVDAIQFIPLAIGRAKGP